jgi:hypothetical protein
MSQDTVSFKVNNNMCEAVGCYATATTEIGVKVGNKGIISLHLCNNCVNKFRDS